MKKYDVWCDGSFRQARNILGSGWVVRAGNQEPTENSVSMEGLDEKTRPHGSDIAELLALRCALSTIPANSVVDVRIDCQNVLDWMKAGEIRNKAKQAVPLLMEQFEHARSLVDTMSEVNFIKVSSSGQNPNHARAHQLSRAPAPAFDANNFN